MDGWERAIKIGASVAGAIAGIFGGWNAVLSALIVAMTLDYISGVVVAACGKSRKTKCGRLDSKVGFVGLAKKCFIIIMVLLATLLDRALGTPSLLFQTATACYYIANEALSIIENAGLMGLPVPAVLKKALEELQKKSEPDKKE